MELLVIGVGSSMEVKFVVHRISCGFERKVALIYNCKISYLMLN